jgi:serine/threonine-protein kinase
MIQNAILPSIAGTVALVESTEEDALPGNVPMAAAADRHLLFGLLALQTGIINQGQLVAAFEAWTLDKSRKLADHLEQPGDLDADDRAAIEALVAHHLRRHGGDVEKSLAEVPVGKSTRESLARIGDPDIEATLSHVACSPGSTDADDADRTPSYAVGTTTSAGQRFRVLRPHARGGLGAVFVALDSELNREVALKQILDQHADDPTSRQRFLIEAEITGGLEHPGIVPVYGLGVHRDGRPYYAMRFIKGDSLREAIERFHADAAPKAAQGRRSLEIRKLLRRFVDVCNAIDYAHSRGVLHRDIKPGNIIVGRYGETLVVDWGLAKPLGRVEPGQDIGECTLVPSSASGSAETLPGSAVGTPAYMSPEQARGELERLGPRSDVYSLGSTLYCLLTGRPPFEGEDIGEVLRNVQRSEFTSLRQIDPSIDKALEAVCLKAMATKPEDRYASCRALAEDVERWAADEPVSAWAEPWTRTFLRWLTRHRTSVTGAAVAGIVALLGLGVVSAVQTKARNDLGRKNVELAQANRRVTKANTELTAANAAQELQRLRAEDREQQAIDAVKRFRDAVANEPELKNTPALENLRKRLLKEPLAFFRDLRDHLQADRDTRPESLARLAEAGFNLGQLTDEIGDKQDALIGLRESLTIRQRLADADPHTVAYKSDLADSHQSIGLLLHATGKSAEALKHYESALAIRRSLANADPQADSHQSKLADVLSNIGIVQRITGRPADALKSYGEALVIRRRLAEANLASDEFQSKLAASYTNVGNVLSDTGKAAESLKSHQAALAIARKLADAHSTVAAYQRDLARSRYLISALYKEAGKMADALESQEAALEIRRKLAEANPTVTAYQSDLATSYNVLGILMRFAGRPGEAMKPQETALAVWRKLAEANPTVTEFRSNLARTHQNIGLLLMVTGKPSEALKHYEPALVIVRKLAEANPTVVEFQRDLARSYNNMANPLWTVGKTAEAKRAFVSAGGVLEKLALAHPDWPDILADLGAMLSNIGAADVEERRFEEGRVRLREALAWQRKALAMGPANPAYRGYLSDNLDNLLEAARGLGDAAGVAEAKRELAMLRDTDPATPALDARLAAIVRGEQRPKSQADRLRLAQRASDKALYATAARLWGEAIQADPKLAEDRRSNHRYNAACAAALAGTGRGKDEPAPDEAARAKLRAQARVWLNTKLAGWAKVLESGPTNDRVTVVSTLQIWTNEPELATVRDPQALQRLPDAERAAWQALWVEVDELLRRPGAGGALKSAPHVGELPADPFAR